MNVVVEGQDHSTFVHFEALQGYGDNLDHGSCVTIKLSGSVSHQIGSRIGMLAVTL